MLRVAQRAPPGVQDEEGDEPADLADGSGGHLAQELHHPTGQLPPHGGRDDHGESDQEESRAVAAVLRLEVAGRTTDGAGDRTDGVGDGEPDRGDATTQGAEGARDRTRTVAYGARCRSLGRGAAASLRGSACGRGLAARRLGGRSFGCRTPRSRVRTRPGRARTPRTRRGRRTGRHGLTLVPSHTSPTHHTSVSEDNWLPSDGRPSEGFTAGGGRGPITSLGVYPRRALLHKVAWITRASRFRVAFGTRRKIS